MIVERDIEHWARYGFGQWWWRERKTTQLIGRVGLQWTEVRGRLVIEVGWVIDPQRWGAGLATEAGAAAVAHGFDKLRIDEVVSFALPANRASRRVMEKLGMRLDGRTRRSGLPHVVYRLRRPSPPAQPRTTT